MSARATGLLLAIIFPLTVWGGALLFAFWPTVYVAVLIVAGLFALAFSAGRTR